MRTIEKYVFGAFMSSFFLAFLVLSFVLTISLMVQIVGYMLKGVPVRLVGRFAVVSFPETMQWTIPLGLLVASILVFSRLSADRRHYVQCIVIAYSTSHHNAVIHVIDAGICHLCRFCHDP